MGKKVYYFLNRKWFFDKIYNEYLGQFFFKFAYSMSYKSIDRGIFEILGPTGLSTIALKVSSNLHKMQTGYIFHYALIILVGAALFFGLREVWVTFEFFIDYRLFILMIMLSFFIVNYVENKN
jgi:NADH:ubiquinone oxidoreductase subunit 5 (subunit L)/multisubunit Na+/H+ antiporter MnhA subunit